MNINRSMRTHCRRPKRAQVRALFLGRDPDSILVCWIGIIASAALTVWLGIWVALEFTLYAPGPTHLGMITLAALFFADWLSGLVHWATDTWFNEHGRLRSVVSIAREHHLYPHHILGYGFREYVAFSSWPTLVLIAPPSLMLTLGLSGSTIVFDIVFTCLIVSVVMFFGTYAHRLGHQRSDNCLVRWLQRGHLLIDPRYHSLHHRGNHDTHYCVINGWANIICDHVGFWRLAEQLIERTTRQVARQNDHEWFRRFRTDPNFPPGGIVLEASRTQKEKSLQSWASSAAALSKSSVSPST
jgi:ubiquitin-conjugating enzyme E2 variant